MKSESVSQRLLSPRKGLTPGGSVGDDEALSNIQPGLLIDGSQCFVLSERALYEFRAGDTTAESLPLIVAPAGGQPGRWRFLTSGTQSLSDEVAVTANDTTPGVLDTKVAAGIGITKTILNPGANEQLSLSVTSTVADVAALAAVNADLVWVSTLRCYWHRNPTSTLTPDGITVVASSIGGNWERLVETSALDWTEQAAWYVNSVSGSDENPGTNPLPLATLNEFNRRLAGNTLRQDTTVSVSADTSLAETRLEIDVGDFDLSITGEPTLVTTGTLSSYTDRNHSIPEGSLIESGDVADWSPYAGQRIRITGGTGNGARTWIESADPHSAGVDVARVGIFTLTGSGNDPAAGSTFAIETLPRIGDLFLNVKGRGSDLFDERVNFDSLQIGSKISIEQRLAATGSPIVFNGCECTGEVPTDVGLVADNGEAVTTKFVATAFQGTDGVAFYNIFLAACVIRNQSFGSSWTCAFRTYCANNLIVGQTFFINGPCRWDNTQLFDSGGVGLQLSEQRVELWNGISGDGHTIGMQIGDVEGTGVLPEVAYNSNAATNLLGTTTDIRIQGTTDIDIPWSATPYDGSQRGVATLVLGTATVTAARADQLRVFLGRNTANGTPLGILEAPGASRTPTQFVINSINPTTGAVETNDVSTVDWYIPPPVRCVRIFDARDAEPAT